MKTYHDFIYNKSENKIKGDFEGAYKNFDIVWPTQFEMEGPHFSFIRDTLRQKQLFLKRPLNVIDVGCGYGAFVSSLENEKIGHITGYDISKTAISKGRDIFGSDLKIFQGSFFDVNWENDSYDSILLLGVLWFLLDDLDNVLQTIKSSLHHDGSFFLTINMPENPIGGEIISSYEDLLAILDGYFFVKHAFTWYSKEAIKSRMLSHQNSNIMLECGVVK